MPIKAVYRRYALRAGFGLLIVVVPLVIFNHIVNMQRLPVMEFRLRMNDPALIHEVLPGGKAESAGVRPGDKIISLNGKPFTSEGIPKLVQNLKIGQHVTLEVDRDGQRLMLEVPLVPAMKVVQAHVIRHSLVALAFWLTGILLLWRRSERPEVRLLFLLSQTLAIGVMFPSTYFINWYPLSLWQHNLIALVAYLSTGFFLHYHITFPVSLGTPHQRRLMFGLIYGLWVIGAVLWVFATRGQLPFVMLILVPVVISLEIPAAIAVLVYVYLRRANPEMRRRLRPLLAGNIIAGIPQFFLFIAPYAIKGYSFVPIWFVALSMFLVLLVYGFATIHHSLLDMDLLLDRTLVYAILVLGIFTLYLVPFLVLDRLQFDNWLSRAVVITGLTLLVALTFDRTRTRVQQTVDRLFFGGWYDYPKVIETVSETLAHSLEWEQFTEVLTRQIPTLMRLHGAQVQVDEQITAPLIPTHQPSMAFPLCFEGQERGIWLVGPRRDGEGFSTTDRRILQTLARQAEIALSNVLLVRQLRSQLEEVRSSRRTLTQAQHRLLRSREEERARLARDLHDGPIQALIGLNIQLGLLEAGSDPIPTALTEAILQMRAEVRDLLAELRAVCAELRPPMLDTLGLGAALSALAHHWSEQQGIALCLELPPDGTQLSLPDEVAVNLYRVVQEALSNIARHAAARQIRLCLQWQDNPAQLSLLVQDDGCGFLPSTVTVSTGQNHFGLLGMQERVASIGGHWSLESSPGRGTTVQVLWLGNDPTHRPGTAVPDFR